MIRPVVVALGFLAATGAGSAADLTVTVTGLRNAQGSLAVCVTQNVTRFPGCGPDDPRRVIPAASANQPIVVKGLKPGANALAVIHDENDNGKLDTNFLGIPREGIAVSNDAVPKFSAPKFRKAAFEAVDGASQTVRMVYW